MYTSIMSHKGMASITFTWWR